MCSPETRRAPRVIGELKRGLGSARRRTAPSRLQRARPARRKTPSELMAVGDHVGIDGAELARVCRLVAKVDNAPVQDGFDLYLHGFIIADAGQWTIVQQEMRRRQGMGQGATVDLADKRARAGDRLNCFGVATRPDGIAAQLARLNPEAHACWRSRCCRI